MQCISECLHDSEWRLVKGHNVKGTTTLEGEDSILDGSYSARKNAIVKCAMASMRKGYKRTPLQSAPWLSQVSVNGIRLAIINARTTG